MYLFNHKGWNNPGRIDMTCLSLSLSLFLFYCMSLFLSLSLSICLCISRSLSLSIYIYIYIYILDWESARDKERDIGKDDWKTGRKRESDRGRKRKRERERERERERTKMKSIIIFLINFLRFYIEIHFNWQLLLKWRKTKLYLTDARMSSRAKTLTWNFFVRTSPES